MEYIEIFDTRIYLNAASLNELEDRLCSVPAKRPYQRYGPFMNGQAPGITVAFLNGIEDFLASLNETEAPTPLPDSRQYGQCLVEYDYEREQ